MICHELDASDSNDVGDHAIPHNSRKVPEHDSNVRIEMSARDNDSGSQLDHCSGINADTTEDHASKTASDADEIDGHNQRRPVHVNQQEDISTFQPGFLSFEPSISPDSEAPDSEVSMRHQQLLRHCSPDSNPLDRLPSMSIDHLASSTLYDISVFDGRGGVLPSGFGNNDTTTLAEESQVMLKAKPEELDDYESAYVSEDHDDEFMQRSSINGLVDARPLQFSSDRSQSGVPEVILIYAKHRNIRGLLFMWAYQKSIPRDYENYIRFDPKYPRTPQDLHQSWWHLERRACNPKSVSCWDRFRLNGTPEMFQYDMLKVWVNFGVHLLSRETWPPTYIPQIFVPKDASCQTDESSRCENSAYLAETRYV
ncbi:MAG: hypothetical protein Q9220_004983 [cf. Caloplaca sp. 1 TL-2023]